MERTGVGLIFVSWVRGTPCKPADVSNSLCEIALNSNETFASSIHKIKEKRKTAGKTKQLLYILENLQDHQRH